MRYSYAYILSMLSLCSLGQESLDFPPPAKPLKVEALATLGSIRVDGILDEKDWQRAQVVEEFFRREPRQGGAVKFKTQVRFLYDDKYLFVGVFCADFLGAEGIRIPDLRRDFGSSSDQFSIALDCQNLKQYAQVFETTPYGNQGDLQNFNGNNWDSGWNTLWKVRTSRTDSGYFAEFAIPFKSLRYDKPEGDEPVTWGLIMTRRCLRDYEVSSFPPKPQSVSVFRMTYAAELSGIKPPPPAANIRLEPYTLYQYDNIQAGAESLRSSKAQLGGDLKWAIDPQTVVDLTVNTDFAQADLDQAVNNLERFNIFFPERRQFFLENSGIWAGAARNSIRPFFSRTIGLQGNFNAEPATIEIGSRFTQRTAKRTIAGLLVRQRGTDVSPTSNFGVARYLHNYGEENNVGLMLTYRLDEESEDLNRPANYNTTITIDGQNRPNSQVSYNYLLSTSIDEETGEQGFAGRISARKFTNKVFLSWSSELTDEAYNPKMGFIRQSNVIRHSLSGYYILRPEKQDWIRRWDPGLFINFNHDATNPTNFQQADIFIFPIFAWFQNNSFLELAVNPIWQNINFNFAPLGLEIERGNYFYNRYYAQFYTDQSKKLSLSTGTSFGGFYNGQNNSMWASTTYAPLPHTRINLSYNLNDLRGVGLEEEDLQTHLVTVSTRFALHPRLQFTTFYQYNSFDQQGRWNLRLSWEYQPLSFLYIVFNDTQMPGSLDVERFQEQQFITKITLIKQF